MINNSRMRNADNLCYIPQRETVITEFSNELHSGDKNRFMSGNTYRVRPASLLLFRHYTLTFLAPYSQITWPNTALTITATPRRTENDMIPGSLLWGGRILFCLPTKISPVFHIFARIGRKPRCYRQRGQIIRYSDAHYIAIGHFPGQQ